MVNANPIFDTVFKVLREDLPSAKLFLSTVIGENIEELQFSPQERTGRVASLGVTVFRLDFCAVISTAKGWRRQVLIELQKFNSRFDIRRFRRYLAENYHEPSPSEVSCAQGLAGRVERLLDQAFRMRMSEMPTPKQSVLAAARLLRPLCKCTCKVKNCITIDS